ncbi:MAG TPA: winged helix-turn-helix transcriptional regulator, partial [Thiolinea sp.]|nr:winged helix-turn-helix transcriptional regulator [Thiolinea sp.]
MKNTPLHQTGGSNLTGIAQYNERLILQLIRRAGSLPKAEIARMTNLSAQTASVIINRLIEQQLLHKQKPLKAAGKVGQPAIPIALNPEGALSLGVKIGRRSLDVILINFVGDILDQITHTYPYPDPDFIFPQISAALHLLRKRLPASHRKRLLGIGIASPYGLGGWQLE